MEREWLAAGYKFKDRLGHCQLSAKNNSDLDGEQAAAAATQRRHDDDDELAGAKEASPIFFQFIDAVHQLLRQFPTEFEFTERYHPCILSSTPGCFYLTDNLHTACECRCRSCTHRCA